MAFLINSLGVCPYCGHVLVSRFYYFEGCWTRLSFECLNRHCAWGGNDYFDCVLRSVPPRHAPPSGGALRAARKGADVRQGRSPY